jgi:hypothetical protein
MANTKTEMALIERRLDSIEAQLTLIANALKKKKVSGLDIGLEELRTGKVHKYRSVKALVADVWS